MRLVVDVNVLFLFVVCNHGVIYKIDDDGHDESMGSVGKVVVVVSDETLEYGDNANFGVTGVIARGNGDVINVEVVACNVVDIFINASTL